MEIFLKSLKLFLYSLNIPINNLYILKIFSSFLQPFFQYSGYQEYNYKVVMNIEKKFIQIFKTFIEKTLVPQIKKYEGSLTEWNKFCSLISIDNINFSELQLYVDTLPSQGGHLLQKPNASKKRQENQGVEFGTFNPSKTFGGERNKLNIFQVSQENGHNQQRQDSSRKHSIQNPNNIVSGLQKLLKSLEENQQIFQNFKIQSTSRQPSSATMQHQTLATHTLTTNSAKNVGRQNQSYGYNHSHTNSMGNTNNIYSYQNPSSNQAYYKSYH